MHEAACRGWFLSSRLLLVDSRDAIGRCNTQAQPLPCVVKMVLGQPRSGRNRPWQLADSLNDEDAPRSRLDSSQHDGDPGDEILCNLDGSHLEEEGCNAKLGPCVKHGPAVQRVCGERSPRCSMASERRRGGGSNNMARLSIVAKRAS